MSHRNRFHNRVAESSFTLPICAILATLMWWWPEQTFSWEWATGWGLSAICIMVSLELNNRTGLIRIRTQLMSAIGFVMAAALPWLHLWGVPIALAVSLSLAFYCTFYTYQNPESMNWTFHSMLFIALGSLFFPLAIVLGPMLLLLQGAFMRSLTWRTFWAGIVGLLTPWWCWLAGAYLVDQLPPLFTHVSTGWLPLWPVDFTLFTQLPHPYQLTWIYLTFWGMIGLFHILYTKYNDKIRVRMMLYVFMLIFLFVEGLMVFYPNYFVELSAFLLVSSVPFIAHYFALTRHWLANLLFLLFVLSTLALWAYNVGLVTVPWLV